MFLLLNNFSIATTLGYLNRLVSKSLALSELNAVKRHVVWDEVAMGLSLLRLVM